MASEAPLSPYRVLDLTGEHGALCGKLLADLGADVIKIEPPEGDPTRRLPPFKDDEPHPERSLRFISLNANKRGITLDLGTAAGAQSFRTLVTGADVLLEDGPPGWMDPLGFTESDLARLNPGLVHASVTGFGLSGPHRGFKAPELVAFAMGGLMNISGDPAFPPCVAPESSGYALGCIATASGIVAALLERSRSGLGQRVEVAAQDVMATMEHNISRFSQDGYIIRRQGSQHGASAPGRIFPAADGFVHIQAGTAWEQLFDWLGRPEGLAGPEWAGLAHRRANLDVVNPIVAAFCRQRPKAALAAEGQARHIAVVPVNHPGEVAGDPHINGLGFFFDGEHPELGRVRHIGAPYLLRGSPARWYRPAPLLGQHNEEVLGALAKGSDRGAEPLSRGAGGGPQERTGRVGGKQQPARDTRDSMPLEGVRIVDFTHVIAGPCLTQLLACLGAEVIKIESERRPDMFRRSGFGSMPPGSTDSRSFNELNRSKRSLAVDLTKPEGIELVRRLVAVSDAVVENFSPGVLGRWGLDYEGLRAIRPDIILMSMQGMGQEGPNGNWVTFGASLLSYSGLTWLWGYPEQEEPVGSQTALPDNIVPQTGVLAMLSALEYRRRTGEGQFIALPQIMAATAMLPTTFLDYFVNHRVAPRQGNSSPVHAPYGCYPCAGEDRWCVIAVTGQDEWKRLVQAMGNPEWAQEERFAGLPGRLRHRQDLDRHLAAWTASRSPHEVMALLQGAGVAAAAVQNSQDLHDDPHLRARDMLVEVPHPTMPAYRYPGFPIKLSRTPGRHWRHAPLLGQDTSYVCRELLGIVAAEFDALRDGGVVSG